MIGNSKQQINQSICKPAKKSFPVPCPLIIEMPIFWAYFFSNSVIGVLRASFHLAVVKREICLQASICWFERASTPGVLPSRPQASRANL